MGNAPDPKDINKDSGIVKYQLTQFEYYDKSTEQRWDSFTKIANPGCKPSAWVQGTLLVEVQEGEKLKIEVFVGKKASEVGGFGDGYWIYER